MKIWMDEEEEEQHNGLARSLVLRQICMRRGTSLENITTTTEGERLTFSARDRNMHFGMGEISKNPVSKR